MARSQALPTSWVFQEGRFRNYRPNYRERDSEEPESAESARGGELWNGARQPDPWRSKIGRGVHIRRVTPLVDRVTPFGDSGGRVDGGHSSDELWNSAQKHFPSLWCSPFSARSAQ